MLFRPLVRKGWPLGPDLLIEITRLWKDAISTTERPLSHLELQYLVNQLFNLQEINMQQFY